MAERTGYPDGAPCWVDMGAADFEGAKRFYGELFGWTFSDGGEEFGHYTMCELDGQPVAGIMPRMDESIPPAWSTYLATSDVDKTTAAVTEHGGRLAMEPMDIPGAGRMCFGCDATGAPFGLWQAGEHIGSTRYGEPGAPCWAEVATRDGAATDAFYAALFPYEQERLDDPNIDFTIWKLGGEVVCGRIVMTEQWPAEVPSHWMAYFAVADCDATVATIKRLGGELKAGSFDTPYGRMAVVADPDGAVFSVITLAG